jgi:hypothetical protein
MHQETNKSTASIKSLSVLIHQDGLSFFVYSASKIEERLDHDFQVKASPIVILKTIEEFHKSYTLLQQEFFKVSLFYHHEMFCLVPDEFFDPSRSSDYLKYNVHILPTDVLSHDDDLGEIPSSMVYIAFENINNFYFEKYGQFEYLHYGSSILNQLLQERKNTSEQLFIEVFQNDFYVSIFKNGQLLSHNLFPFQAAEDILYYVMFSIQQNELDPNTLHCSLKGIGSLTHINDLLYNYIRNIFLEKDYHLHLTRLLCA